MIGRGELQAHDIDCVLNQGGETDATCTCGMGAPAARWQASLMGSRSYIDPTAKIGKNVRIGVGVVVAEGVVIEDDVSIWHHANILPQAHIKKGAMVAFCCQIERGVVIGARSRIQPYAAPGSGSKIGADVYFGPYSCTANSWYPPSKRLVGGIVEDGAIIGMGVYIWPGVRIGKRAVVGTGSIVTHDIPPEEVWFGHPVAYATTRAEYDRKQKEWEASDKPPDTTPRYKVTHAMEGEPEKDPQW